MQKNVIQENPLLWCMPYLGKIFISHSKSYHDCSCLRYHAVLDAGEGKKPARSIIKIEEVTAFHRHLFYLEDEGSKPSKTLVLNYMASF